MFLSPELTTDVLNVFERSIGLDLSKRALYSFDLSRPGNVVFLVVFAGIFIFNLILAFRSKQIYYNVCFLIGFLLETLGYLGRILGFTNQSSMGYYILQSFCLTIAPAFIMAGIYFMFAQIVTIYGGKYSVLKPMWYSYIFITSDVLSILVQGGGGGISAQGSGDGSNIPAGLGDTIMFVGILIQIIAMTFFLIFWFLFLGRTFFQDRLEVLGLSEYKHRSFANYMKMILNIDSARTYKMDQLDEFYNPQYLQIRRRRLFSYYPLAISVAVILVYIRCVYRVVELKMGFNGYLMQHEIYLFALDSALIALTGVIFVPFHPMFVFGRFNVLTSKDIKKYLIESQESVLFADEKMREENYDIPAQGREETIFRTTL